MTNKFYIKQFIINDNSFQDWAKDNLEDISELPASTRKKIRRALKIYNFRKISLFVTKIYKIYFFFNDGLV